MGGRDTDIVLLDENGIRCDGRKVNETRKVTIKAGVLKNANGSAYIEFGDNKILVGVYGPRDVHPKHMSDTDTGILRCRYHMAPFSVGERKNPAPSRREVEISKVIKEALEPAVMLKEFPRTAVDVYMEVLQADGGTRCAALTGASVALADAGIPMRDLVAGCAAGKAADKQLRGQYGSDYKKRPNYSQEKAKLQAQFLATMTQEFGMQFAEGGAVTTDVNMMQATPGGIADVNIEETSTTQPRQDLPQLSYDEIRARLPKEIGDDIVTLLANSYEALADFAEIRTQSDVDSFNLKYQVQLVPTQMVTL